MKYPLPAIVKVQTEWGPDAAGATSDDSPQGDAGGARRRPRLRFVGSSAAVPVPMLSRTPWPGTDGNQSCGCGDCGAGDEDTPALFSMRGGRARGLLVDDAALHAAGDGHDLAGDVSGQLVRRQHDDLARDVVGLRNLAQRHRP